MRIFTNQKAIALAACIQVTACSTSGPEIKRREDFELSFTLKGFERHVQVHVPAGAPAGFALPLVLVLHGSGMDAGIIRSISALDALSDEMLFHVAYPDAYRSWAYPGSATAALGVDDVAFIAELLDRLERLLEVDPDRVSVTGFSSGGFMTHAVACALSDRFAAAMPVAATLWSELSQTCRPTHRLSVLMVHGTVDRAVPLDGDSTLGRWSVSESAEFWARHNGCDSIASTTRIGRDVDSGIALDRWTYRNCGGGAEVQLDLLDGGGHQWTLAPFSISTLVAEFGLRQQR
jgi:polyhydroxybutyrate depolymerase